MIWLETLHSNDLELRLRDSFHVQDINMMSIWWCRIRCVFSILVQLMWTITSNVKEKKLWFNVSLISVNFITQLFHVNVDSEAEIDIQVRNSYFIRISAFKIPSWLQQISTCECRKKKIPSKTETNKSYKTIAKEISAWNLESSGTELTRRNNVKSRICERSYQISFIVRQGGRSATPRRVWICRLNGVSNFSVAWVNAKTDRSWRSWLCVTFCSLE